MPLNGHYDANTKAYLLALQIGQKPNSRPPIPAYWESPVATIERSYDRSGGNVKVVRDTVSTLSRQIPHLAELLTTERPATTLARVDESGMPLLSEPVKAQEARAAEASPTLDALILYFQYWATRSYEGYHEAVALWVLSTIAARRVVLHWQTGVWTSLYIMLVSKSGRVAKTKAVAYGVRVIRECGLGYLLAPDEITPQRLVSRMSGRSIPRNYSVMNWEEKEYFRLQTAFAGQKGWPYDEFGDFLQEIASGKGQNSLFYRLLKQLYDEKPEYRYDTITRNEEKIDFPALSIIGTTAPESLVSVSNKSTLWSDGAAARIIFVAPPPSLVLLKSAPEGEAVIPEGIKQKLQAWHERLGYPPCQIIDTQEREELMSLAHGEEKKRKEGKDKDPYIIERGELPQNDIYWSGSGVREAHEAYYQDLVKIGVEHNLDSRLNSNYIRLPDMALKIAMLLASLENDNYMTMAHWARGQQITERWRRDLHCLIAQLDSGAPDRNVSYGALEEKVRDVLANKLPKGEKASARQIMMWGNTALRPVGSPEVRKILNNLVDEGEIIREGQVNDKRALYGLKEEE